MFASSQLSKHYEQVMRYDMSNAGFTHCRKISDTLQGSIWSAIHQESNYKVVIKVTNKTLHSKSMIRMNGNECKVYENILKEKEILKYLTVKSKPKTCPDSIVKYIGYFDSSLNHYLVMEHGGKGLFEFIVEAHELIEKGQIEISQWHKVVQIIFKQMIECIEYIHSQNVCHFDISLENFLINDVLIIPYTNNDNGRKYIKFLCSDIQIKICDFGLSELFENVNGNNNKSNNFYTNKYCGKTTYKSPEIHGKKRLFNAKSNDIWCLGVCLFMMLIGGQPWKKPKKNYESFVMIMNGQYIQLFTAWKKIKYVNNDICDLFYKIFKYENHRINLQEIKQHSWLNNK